MNWRLQQMTRVDYGRYRAILVCSENDEAREFTFSVDEGEIDIVNWGEDLTTFLKFNTGLAEPLMRTVLSFHHSQRLLIH